MIGHVRLSSQQTLLAESYRFGSDDTRITLGSRIGLPDGGDLNRWQHAEGHNCEAIARHKNAKRCSPAGRNFIAKKRALDEGFALIEH